LNSTIDATTMALALSELSQKSLLINNIVSTLGSPPLWRREPGFSSLVYTILEQQVSLASAKAAYDKLLRAVGTLTPETFLRLDDSELRLAGFSRQKTNYCRILSHQIVRRELDLVALNDKSDDDIRDALTAVKGIGKWTANIYLLHSLGRPDVWPTGDLALRVAAMEILGMEDRPSEQQLQTLGDEFRPWRSVAARVFWHSYLSKRGISEVS
jgi:DNA-3-methyladenine glycosylase II